jgi:hypothetical protein
MQVGWLGVVGDIEKYGFLANYAPFHSPNE